MQRLRKALRESDVFNEVEQVLLLNLAPADLEDALSWIPSLESAARDERAGALKRCVDLVQKAANMIN